MKKILLAGILVGLMLCLVCKAHAAGAYSIQPSYTYQTAVSSITVVIVSVSTSSLTGATQVDNPQLSSRVSLEIQNIDSSASLWCLPISTMPVASGGRKITAGSSWVISTRDKYYSSSGFSAVKFWCLSDGTSPTKAAVTQAY